MYRNISRECTMLPWSVLRRECPVIRSLTFLSPAIFVYVLCVSSSRFSYVWSFTQNINFSVESSGSTSQIKLHWNWESIIQKPASETDIIKVLVSGKTEQYKSTNLIVAKAAERRSKHFSNVEFVSELITTECCGNLSSNRDYCRIFSFL